MKKIILGFTAAVLVSCFASFSAFAGQWLQDEAGWWYQNEDGSFPTAEWKWIDNNGDGIAECYYFYSDGYMAYNNDIENQHLNDDGQWVINGVVQRRTVSQKTNGQKNMLSTTYERDYSYVKYLQEEGLLVRSSRGASDSKYFDVHMRASQSTLIDLGDCYEIQDVSIYLPYEYDTKKEAEAKLQELSHVDFEFLDGYVERQANGKYRVYAREDDYDYSYKAWTGSIYICKDATISFLTSQVYYKCLLVNEVDRRAQEEDNYGILCVIDDIDENGYVTKLLEAQWG